MDPATGVVLSGIGVFALALTYATAQYHVFSGGASAGGSVWFTQPLLVPVLCFAVGGFGKWMRGATLVLWTWVIVATWWFKLIPLYGGFGGGKATAMRLFDWYAGAARSELSATALLPAAWIYAIAAVATAGAVLICVALLRLRAMDSIRQY
jgi:hypothetical protein